MKPEEGAVDVGAIETQKELQKSSFKFLKFHVQKKRLSYKINKTLKLNTILKKYLQKKSIKLRPFLKFIVQKNDKSSFMINNKIQIHIEIGYLFKGCGHFSRS